VRLPLQTSIDATAQAIPPPPFQASKNFELEATTAPPPLRKAMPTHSQHHEPSRPMDISSSSVSQVYDDSASPTQTHHSQSTHASASRASASPSSYPFLQAGHGSAPQAQLLVTPDVNITGLVGSLPSSAPRQNPGPRPASLETYLNQLAIWPEAIPTHVEDHLINVYFNNANRRWPFLLKDTFYSWHACWKKRSAEQRHHGDLWQGFFVNMVRPAYLHQRRGSSSLTPRQLFAVSLLLDPKQPLSVSHTSQVNISIPISGSGTPG
jgi:hypothetical protein